MASCQIWWYFMLFFGLSLNNAHCQTCRFFLFQVYDLNPSLKNKDGLEGLKSFILFLLGCNKIADVVGC